MERSILVAVLLGSLAVQKLGAVTVDELPKDAEYTIEAIHVEGTERVSGGAVRDAMLTELPPWYKFWERLFKEVEFNPSLFRSDLDRVRAFLRESGYYEARVDHDLVVENGAVEITIRIQEGPPAEVSEVELTATDFTLSEELESELRTLIPLESDDRFTQQEYDESRDKLERYFLERGFAYATVEKSAVVDTGTNRARVTYTMRRGQPAVFGETTIRGLSVLEPVLVRRELTYEAGQPYDPTELELTQAKLFGLELFRSVVVQPANLEERSGVVDIAIDAIEGPPRSIRVGIGYGLEDEVRGQVQWQHNNFYGNGRRLGFRLKGSFIEQAAEGEFRQPYFLHPQQTFILPLTQAREDEPGFTVARTRMAPRLERRFRPELTASIGYNIEYDDLTDVPDETKLTLEEFEARGFVSSLVAVVERNTTTDVLDPHEGSVFNLTLEQAGGPWQGDFSFYRGTFEAKKYVPVFGDRVLAGRFKIGAGDGFGDSGDLPVFRRFFAGGINSTRGYDRHELGPLTEGEDPIGGRSLLEGSLEFRTPVYGSFGAVVFFDIGLVDRRVFRYELNDLQYGLGPGIRYQTPVGPIRLDIGFAPNAPSELPGWQIHFSIGQAF